DADGVGTRRDRADGAGDRLGQRRRIERAELPLEREDPRRVAAGAALQLVAAGGDRDELLAVNLVDDGRRVGAESRLESPELLAGLGVQGQEVAVRVATEDEAAGRDRRPTAAAQPVRRLMLPRDLVRR